MCTFIQTREVVIWEHQWKPDGPYTEAGVGDCLILFSRGIRLKVKPAVEALSWASPWTLHSLTESAKLQVSTVLTPLSLKWGLQHTVSALNSLWCLWTWKNLFVNVHSKELPYLFTGERKAFSWGVGRKFYINFFVVLLLLTFWNLFSNFYLCVWRSLWTCAMCQQRPEEHIAYPEPLLIPPVLQIIFF